MDAPLPRNFLILSRMSRFFSYGSMPFALLGAFEHNQKLITVSITSLGISALLLFINRQVARRHVATLLRDRIGRNR